MKNLLFAREQMRLAVLVFVIIILDCCLFAALIYIRYGDILIRPPVVDSYVLTVGVNCTLYDFADFFCDDDVVLKLFCDFFKRFQCVILVQFHYNENFYNENFFA